MKIELEIEPKEFEEKVVKLYAEKLFESNSTKHWFGFKSDVADAVRKHALKIIETDDVYKREIKKLLSDDKFLKKAVGITVKELADDIMRELKD